MLNILTLSVHDCRLYSCHHAHLRQLRRCGLIVEDWILLLQLVRQIVLEVILELLFDCEVIFFVFERL